MTAEGGERQGRVDFFAGAIASYKNPHSHRDVNLNDPYEALEVICLSWTFGVAIVLIRVY
jgi:hypothetical protein